MRLFESRERYVAAAGSTLTLGELRYFVEQLTREGAADTTPILRGSGPFRVSRYVTNLRATIVRFGDPAK